MTILTGDELARLPAVHEIATKHLEGDALIHAVEQILRAQIQALRDTAGIFAEADEDGEPLESPTWIREPDHYNRGEDEEIWFQPWCSGHLVFIPDEKG